ncbi:hypothetical protein GA0115259_104281, partial [Streptomyces sp. MnatMP-M17]
MASGYALYGRAERLAPRAPEPREAQRVRTAVLEGVAGWVPGEPVPNEALPASWGVDDAWVRTRTGIASRHRAGAGVSTGDLAYEAARRLLGGAGPDPGPGQRPGPEAGAGAAA